MDVIDRIKLLIEEEKLTRESLASITGVSYTRWQTVLNRKGKARHDDIEALGKAFPNYAYWIAYGTEIPEAGQISPMTKKAQRDYRETGTDS